MFMENYRNRGELFNSDIKVIRERLAVVVKNKSIWTGSIYGEIKNLRGNVQQ
jgi:hypothetical protein